MSDQAEIKSRFFRCMDCHYVTEKKATEVLPMQPSIACDNCGNDVDATLPQLRRKRAKTKLGNQL